MNSAYVTLGGYWYVLFVIVFAISFGVLCILVDKLRLLFWNLLCKLFIDRLILRFQKIVENVFTKLGYN